MSRAGVNTARVWLWPETDQTLQKYDGAKYGTYTMRVEKGNLHNNMAHFDRMRRGGAGIFLQFSFSLLRPKLTRSTQSLVNVRWDLLDPFLMRIAEARRIFKSDACRPQTFGPTHTSPSCPTSKDVAINLNHPNARKWGFSSFQTVWCQHFLCRQNFCCFLLRGGQVTIEILKIPRRPLPWWKSR